MCPACIATGAYMATGAASMGGIAALIVSRLRGHDNHTDESSRETNGHPKEGEKSDDEA